jgi:carbohydrate-selective porin OprB
MAGTPGSAAEARSPQFAADLLEDACLRRVEVKNREGALLSLELPKRRPAPATSAQQETNNETFKDPKARVFELALPSEQLFGDWGGLRPRLEESGITPRLILVTDLARNHSGGRSQGATAPSNEVD